MLVQGMQLRYFYTWAVVGGVCILYLMVLLLNATRPNSNVTVIQFVVSLLACAVVFLGLKFYFGNKSRTVKMKFRNQKVVLSNIDIMKAIK